MVRHRMKPLTEPISHGGQRTATPQGPKLYLTFTICLLLISSQFCANAAPAAAPAKSAAAATPPKAAKAAAPPTTTAAAPKAAPAAPAPKAATAAAPKAAAAAPKTAKPAPAAAPKVAAAPKAAAAAPKAAAPAPAKSATKLAPAPAKSKASPPAPAITAPAPAPAAIVSTSGLDAAQILALTSLKVNFTKNAPCLTDSDILMCDSADNKPRHVVALSLTNCPKNAVLTSDALKNLSSVAQLSFTNCPMKPVTVPSDLIATLTTLIIDASLGKTGTNMKAKKLTGSWLAKFVNLDTLHVSNVEISVSSLYVIIQNMVVLTHLTLNGANIGDVLPRNTWPTSMTYIDVSGNQIRGTLPSQIRQLSSLTHLDVSNNQLKGKLPDIFGELSQMQHLDLHGNQFSGVIPGSFANMRNCSYLDLSNNKLNGSIPANLTNMKPLKYLDLSQNNLQGPIPFNATFLKKLTTLKLDNNPGLCYNHSDKALAKIKALADIANCAGDITPIEFFAPAPAPAAGLTSSSKSSRLSAGAAVGVSFAAILGAALLGFLGFRFWKARQDPDRFINLGKP